MARERDSQRHKVYAAENAVWDVLPLEAVADPQAFVDEVINDTWAQDMFPRLPAVIKVVEGNRVRATAYVTSREIMLPPSALLRTKWVLLHEIAHFTTEWNAAAHGWEFAENMLHLVRQYLGWDAHAALLAQYLAHGVKYAKPKVRAKRTLTDEQRAAAAERLAAARPKADPVIYVRWTTIQGERTPTYITSATSRRFVYGWSIRRAKIWKTGPRGKLAAELAEFGYEPVRLADLEALRAAA